MIENGNKINDLVMKLGTVNKQRTILRRQLAKLRASSVKPGSVLDHILAKLKAVDRPVHTTFLLDMVMRRRPNLSRRACSSTLYRAAAQGQVVRTDEGWVLPKSPTEAAAPSDAPEPVE